MKTSIIKIKQYTFLNPWEIEYRVGRNYFIMAIEDEDLETVFERTWGLRKYDSPQDFLEQGQEDNQGMIEKLLTWFHTEFADEVEPIERERSLLYQKRIKECEDNLPVKMVGKAQKVIFKTTFEKQNGLWQEVASPAYIKAIADRLFELEKEMQELKEEKKQVDDILLTTDSIEQNYKISPNTINNARRYGRIQGVKINDKSYAYKKREIERYISSDKRLQKLAS